MGSTPSAVPAGHVRPVEMPFVDRLASAVVTAVPPIMVAIGMWFGWVGNLLNWQDLLILAVMYAGVGTGITLGFHRLLTHGSFRCHRLTRAAFAARVQSCTCCETNSGTNATMTTPPFFVTRRNARSTLTSPNLTPGSRR